MGIGELAALSAAVLWSFSSFVFTEATARISTLMLNVIRLFLAAFLLIITILILNSFNLINLGVTNAQLYYLTLSGIIGLVIGDTFLFRGFKDIGPRITMLIMSFNPAIAAIFAFYILGEHLSFQAFIGMTITLIGISIVILDKPPQKEEKVKFKKIGLLWGLLAAAGQGIGLIAAKMGNTNGSVDVMLASFIRIFTAGIIMTPLLIIAGRFKNPLSIFKNDKKALKYIFIGSIIGPYLGITLSFVAIIHTDVAVASTLMSTVPILMLPIAKFVYKEKLSVKAIIGAVIAVAGVALLTLPPVI